MIINRIIKKLNWNRNKGRILWISGYIRQYWKEMVFYMLLGFSGTILSFISTFISKNLVDIVTGENRGQVVSTFISMIGMTLASTLVGQITSYFSTMVNLKVENNIKSEFFEKVLKADWEDLSRFRTGDLLFRWSGDSSALASGILSYIPNIFMFLARFIIAFCMMARYDFSFAMISLFGMPFTFFISRRLAHRMKKSNLSSMTLSSRISSFNQEAFSNIQTIKAFDLIGSYVRELKSIQEEQVKTRLTYQKIMVINSILMVIVGLIISYASYGWGIYRVWSGAITYGTMTMFLSLSSTLSGSLNNLFTLIPSGIPLITSASRLMEIESLREEDFSDRDFVKDYYEKYCQNGIGVEIDYVKYSYKNGNEVYEDVSLYADPNEVVALIGPSGEGKTTMLRMLLALIKPKRGKAFIYGDGVSPIDISPSLRQYISYVPQGNTMFSGTIADNLRKVKEDATDEEIINALKSACAWEFVKKLPNGINTEIKERGGGFSEGQAQRLSLARAFLRRSPILLLDEATSALDPDTSRKILKNITEDKYPRTCILTTHRPSMLKGCTRVYRIADKECHELTREEIKEVIERG